MKRLLYPTILLLATLSTQAVAQEVPIFPKGEKSPNVHHTGDVWLNELNGADSTFNFSIAVATFEPGAKLDWHIHPGGQILLYLSQKVLVIIRKKASLDKQFIKGMLLNVFQV